MHVLYLIDQLTCAGGTELHLWDLSSGLCEQNIKVTVVSFDDDSFAQRFRDHSNIEYYCLDAPCIYNLKGIKALLWLHRYMRDRKVDIVQSFHTASDFAAPILGLIALGKTTVISSRRDLGYTKTKKHLYLQKILNNFVKVILANSEQVKLAVIEAENVAAEKVHVIYNGINADKVSVLPNYDRGEYRINHGIPPDCTLVGALGNSRPVKGFLDFIQAAKVLSETYPDIYFVLAGESDDLIDDITAAGLTDRFFLLGPVKDVGNYLNALDIYVQPSHSEGFSNAVLEAMLAQLPVVISAVGGNVEIVKSGEDGLHFQVKNVRDLVVQIGVLVDDPIFSEKLAAAASKKVINSFMLERMLTEYSTFYR